MIHSEPDIKRNSNQEELTTIRLKIINSHRIVSKENEEIHALN
jgi:hypothetical protein